MCFITLFYLPTPAAHDDFGDVFQLTNISFVMCFITFLCRHNLLTLCFAEFYYFVYSGIKKTQRE